MANALILSGKFIAARPTEYVGAKNYPKRRFYIDTTTNPDFPNTPELWLKGDKVNLIDQFQKGDEIEVSLNVEGRKYTSKKTGKHGVINEISVWKVETSSQAIPDYAAPSLNAPRRSQPTQMAGFDADDNGDGLPF